jgi:hypothetical protein
MEAAATSTTRRPPVRGWIHGVCAPAEQDRRCGSLSSSRVPSVTRNEVGLRVTRNGYVRIAEVGVSGV